MSVELRPYQKEAISTIVAALKAKDNCLLQAATGGGKTIIFASLISQWINAYPKMKIMVLAHRQELIDQAYEKLTMVDPTAWTKTGKACAGLGRVITDSQVVIGTLQTLVRRKISQQVQLLIVDEAHRIPSMDQDSQYRTLIWRLREEFPRMRLLGVTATPFRLKHGYIYGQENDWFDDLDYSINLKTLISDGYLVPIRIKINESEGLQKELAKVEKSGGEYKIDSLQGVMCKQTFISTAVEAWENYGEGRLNAIIFAVTIQHAELLRAAFIAAGHKVGIVHSKMPQQERKDILNAFERSEINFVVNVGILTEGWDSPKVDLIIMARPTLSPGLYVQMIGRGTRLYPGKENLLILDLANNSLKHGPPWDPIIKEGLNSPEGKVCPKCRILIEKTWSKECPECGYVFDEPELSDEEKVLIDYEQVTMKELGMGKEVLLVVYEWEAYVYESRNGNEMVKFTLRTNAGPVNEFLDFEGNSGQWSYKKAWKWWVRMADGSPPPKTATEACESLDKITIPTIVTACKEGKFWKVVKWGK
jgi:DNA repair protein RadD